MSCYSCFVCCYLHGLVGHRKILGNAVCVVFSWNSRGTTLLCPPSVPGSDNVPLDAVTGGFRFRKGQPVARVDQLPENLVDGHPTWNPYNWYINPYYWVDESHLLWSGNFHGSLDRPDRTNITPNFWGGAFLGGILGSLVCSSISGTWSQRIEGRPWPETWTMEIRVVYIGILITV